MKSWAVNVALVVGSVLITLVACEIGFRALGYYGQRGANLAKIYHVPEDQILDYRMIKNAEWVHNGIDYRTNNHGWRDYDYTYEKPDGVFRIVALGDSVLNGHGVAVEDVYAKHLERMANSDDSGVKVEVIMLAIGALSTEQEAHLLEVEGLKYGPDLITVGYVLNDPGEGPSFSKMEKRSKEISFFQKVRQNLKNLSVVYYTYRAIDNLGWKLGVQVLGGAKQGAARIGSDYYERIHGDAELWQTVVEGMKKIRRLSDQVGAKVVVAIFPIIYDLENYRWSALHEQVRDLAEDQGFAVIDLLDVYRQEGERSLRLGWGDYTHPNPRGHAIAGAALHEFLCEGGFMPAPCSAN